jgi:acyl carrier protein phosphodiesterase
MPFKMNFLAHLMLSGEQEEVIMGNFVADFIKGKLLPERVVGWSPEFLLGVRLHRFIDSYTDAHPLVRQVRHRVALRHPKVAGVAVDMFFDHFLANHFEQYHAETLPNFCAKMYRIIDRHQALVPLAMQPMARAMVQQHWLEGYAEVAGIGRALEGLARRFPFMVAIRGAEKDLLCNYELYEQQFHSFFRELEVASDAFIFQTTP